MTTANVSTAVVPRTRATVVVWSLAFAVFAYALQQTAIYPAIPVIQHDLHTSTGWVTWIVSIYLLVSATSTPLAGKLGDQYGKKRVLVCGLIMFFLGAVAAALARDVPMLLAARAVQGVGGVTIPLSAAIIRDELPRERVGAAIGLLFAVTAVGMSAGVALGGAIVQLLSWQASFAVAAVLIALALALVVVAVPESPFTTPTRRDAGGAALLSLCLVSLLLAITQAEEWGWLSAPVLGLFAISLASAPIWVRRELRLAEPLIDVRMLSQRNVALTNAASAAWGFAIVGPLLFVPRFVEARGSGYGFGASTVQAGLYLMPGFAVGLVSGPAASRLGRGRSPALPLGIGAALLSGGCLLIAFVHARPWEVILGCFVVGVGWPIGSAAMANTILASVRPGETASATAITQVIRGIGSALGAQIGAALLAALVLARTVEPTEGAYTAIFLTCGGAAALALVCAFTLGPPRRYVTPTATPTPEAELVG